MIVFPNAKINLGLDITSKRDDGFHNIESVFVGINWCDALEFKPSKETSFTSSGLNIPSNGDSNLVLKALNLLKQDFDLPNLTIHLEKKIPIGAGLGGGSSDCSFMLSALNQYFQLDISQKKLEQYALLLGSDCPFFISNKISKVKGRGEILTPLEKIDLRDYHIALINPNIHISTKEAYAGIIPKQCKTSFETILNQPVHNWADLKLKNDFETSIFPKYPEIKSLKESLYSSGALYASMTGSGSTVFGIFDSKPSEINTKHPNYQIFQGKLL